MEIGQKLYNLCVSAGSHNFNEAELVACYEGIEYDEKVKFFVIQSSHLGVTTYKESDFERYYGCGAIYSTTKEESKRKCIEKIESEIRGFECRIKEKQKELEHARNILI